MITHLVDEAAKGANVIYTDTILSYHIPKNELEVRRRVFKPFQVNQELMAKCAKDAIFMHCLPATRGDEVTAEVIDGPQIPSILGIDDLKGLFDISDTSKETLQIFLQFH